MEREGGERVKIGVGVMDFEHDGIEAGFCGEGTEIELNVQGFIRWEGGADRSGTEPILESGRDTDGPGGFITLIDHRQSGDDPIGDDFSAGIRPDAEEGGVGGEGNETDAGEDQP
jgi:hypothetical protein